MSKKWLQYHRKDKCFFEFEEKIKERKSAIDKKTPIDMDHWCVTMFNSDTSGILEPCPPCTWMGHALLIVETIEEGNYFARQIDLVKNGKGDANIRCFELFQPEIKGYIKDYAKSETHRRPKEDIQRIIDRTYKDICNQKEGKPSVIFALDSGKMKESLAILSYGNYAGNLPLTSLVQQRNRMNRRALSQEQLDIYNCIYYVVNKLYLAKIKDPLVSRYVLSKMFWPTPVLYAGSKLKAIGQEVSLIASYSALFSTGPSFIGFVLAGPIGASFGLGVGCTLALRDIFSAYKADADQLQEQKSETKKEEKKI
ncbi:MAG: hypothetical protein WBD50_08730 [Candidatus Rhabdochlamydia sp.]